MKTTIDIPENELLEAIRHTGAKTKRAAVVFALQDFNRRRRLAALTGMLGTFTDFMTQDDLLELRKDAVCRKRGSR
jgi:Arc/MetJ family transcription regulator